MKRIEDLSILILEDDRIFAEVLSRNLSRVGLDMSKITIYDSIETDDQEFNNLRPDVVFLDLNIIGYSGLDTFYTAEPIFPGACFIILSGHNDEKLALSCMEAGAQDYISKSDASAYALLKSIQYGLIRKQQLLKEEIYVKAFKHSPFASVITKGKDGEIVETNNAYDQLMGKGSALQEKKLPIVGREKNKTTEEKETVTLKTLNGEERTVEIWTGCIDPEEDLHLYKLVEKVI